MLKLLIVGLSLIFSEIKAGFSTSREKAELSENFYFGSSAIYWRAEGRPVAFRPRLATGLAFSIILKISLNYDLSSHHIGWAGSTRAGALKKYPF
jgi:hypothetical protein